VCGRRYGPLCPWKGDVPGKISFYVAVTALTAARIALVGKEVIASIPIVLQTAAA
jgi:hypothetical protein